MRSLFTLLVVLLLLANTQAQTGAASSRTKHDENEKQQEYDFKWLEEEIESLRKKALVPGLAVGIVYKDQLVFAKGFGTRTEGKNEPVNEHTLFGIASNTKAFTAMGIMMLAEQGKLDLDDKVVKHLPWFAAYHDYVTNEMTIKDLLTHRSGLKTFSGDLIWYASTHTREEVVKRSRHLVPTHNFRDQFGYSNIHFLTAGLIIEKVSGMSYDEFLEKNIFEPLGMDRTNSSITKNPKDNVASPHAIKYHTNIPVPYVNWDNIAPAGSINSSVADMAKWIGCLIKGTAYGKDQRLISQAGFYKMLSPVTNLPVSAGSRMWFPTKHFNAYALGLNVFDYHGALVANHSGGLVGMVSQTAFVPEKDFGIIILSNNETALPGMLMYDLLDFMMKKEYQRIATRYIKNMLQSREEDKKAFEEKWKDAQTGVQTPEKITAYAGKYSGKVYGGVTITTDGNTLNLTADHTPMFHATLHYWKNDTFWFELPEFPSLPRGTVTYKRNSSGEFSQVVIDIPNPDFDFTELDLYKQ